MSPDHITLLIDDAPLVTEEDHEVEVCRLQTSDDDNLVSWAKHVREHYCLDSEIDELREVAGLSMRDYFKYLVLPDRTEKPGPAVRRRRLNYEDIFSYCEHTLGLDLTLGLAAITESLAEIDDADDRQWIR